MKIHLKDYRVAEGEVVDLKKRETRVDPVFKSKAQYDAILAAHVEKLSELHRMHYASNKFAVLVIFQAMDAAGKDGAIRHVMSGVNPQGCQVFSFKHPSATELEHDFLWRTTRDLPERGRIGIFNRSYYEEVPIVDFERHLHANGTRIVKIFLHLSKEEQRLRFLARIDDPDKNWKLSLADIAERKFWKDYRKAYEGAIAATSTKDSPWYVVPADDKDNARLMVSQIVVDALEGLKPHYPKATAERVAQLQAIRADLTADD
jgi:polyphosphate kinase 2 (PPK2 family)